MKRHKNQTRQGDVFIERVESLPKTPKRKSGRVILAEGEVTGHAHEVDDHKTSAIEPITGFKLPGDLVDAENMTRQVMKLGRDTVVKHDEHGKIPHAKGGYRTTIQREYSPQQIRNVAD